MFRPDVIADAKQRLGQVLQRDQHLAEHQLVQIDPAPTPAGGGMPGHELDPLLDSRTKAKARTAPLALFVLVVLVLIIYLATAR